MKSFKELLGNIVAFIYFIFPMSIIILLTSIMPIGFLMDVKSVRSSGYAGGNTIASFIGLSGFFIGLSLLIPALRKMYRVLPWLYSFIKIFFVNLVILSIGLIILNKGYEVKNDFRHTLTFILMIVQIVICRIGMCIYFKKKQVRNIE